MKMAEDWTQAEAEAFAGAYASAHVDLIAHTRAQEQLKEQIRRYMEINNLDELIDPEVGEGVEFGPAPSNTRWDIQNMPENILVPLARRGVMTIDTKAIDAIRKVGGGVDIDDAQKYRITGSGTRPLKVAVRE